MTKLKRECLELSNKNIYAMILKERKILVINKNFKGKKDIIYLKAYKRVWVVKENSIRINKEKAL